MSITVFICGARPIDCYRCKTRAVKRCDGPGQEPGSTCDRPLCADHARGTKCSTHAPSTASATMPKPPGRA